MLAPAFALIDGWHRADKLTRDDLFYRALWDGVAQVDEIGATLPMFARVRGRRQLERLLALAQLGATSPLEVLARTRVFTGGRFARFEWQAPVRVAGRERTVDMLHRDEKVAVEFDGRAYHGGDDSWFSDRERDVEFSAAGYVTLRFTFRDLLNRPQWCRDQVLAAVQVRALSDVRT
jgi:very-short-patch-repair endonuclease